MPALTTVYDSIPASTFNFLIPAALTSLLASILLRFEIAYRIDDLVEAKVLFYVGASHSF